jgi:hypothetical protein
VTVPHPKQNVVGTK